MHIFLTFLFFVNLLRNHVHAFQHERFDKNDVDCIINTFNVGLLKLFL